MPSEQHSMAENLPDSAAYQRKRGAETRDDADDKEIETSADRLSVKREVGLMGGVALIVGTMIGSGIFISPKGVLEGTGSVGLCLTVWTLCGLIAMLSSLSYVELGTMITKSGAEYAYILEALGPVPAYLYSWTSVVVLKPSSLAVICLAFAKYVTTPLFDPCGPPEIVNKLLAAAAIITVSAVNSYSVKLASRVQIVFTFAKLLALVIIIVGGLVKIGQGIKYANSTGNTETLSEGFVNSVNSPSTVALAFYSGLWAYDGWNNLNFVTEELKNPFRNLPLAIIIAIPLVTLVYLLTNISYYSMMSRTELLFSNAVAVTWGERVLSSAAVIIPVSVALSTFGAANGSCFTGGRVCFSSAREGHLPDILSYLHVQQYTPLTSLLFICIISLIMIIPGDIGSLIDFFSFSAWLFYGTAFVSLLVLRFTKKDLPRPFKVPIVIPVLMVLVSLYLVIAPIVENPQIQFLYAFLFIIGGMVFYIPFVHFKLVIPGFDKVTEFFQLFLEVCPSKYQPL